MRFETSQATPSYLDRRVQLRMLSFVGLISIVMFTLSVFTHPPKSGSDSSRQVSPDSLVYEEENDRSPLKPDEVIVQPTVEDREPRGQWAEHRSDERSRTDLADTDRELFKPRSQERLGDQRFFTRRKIPADRSEIDAPEIDAVETPVPISDKRPTKSEPAFDEFLADEPETPVREERPVRQRKEIPPIPVGRPNPNDELPFESLEDERPKSRTAPPVEDDWIPSNKPIARPRVDDVPKEPAYREPKPAGGKRQRDREDLGSIFDETVPPKRSGNVENDPAQAPHMTSPKDDDLFLDEPAPKAKPARTKPRRDVPTERPVTNDDTPPIRGFDRDPESARSRTRRNDDEMFRDDRVSPRIDRRYLDLVKDNTLGVRSDEAEVFYWLIDHARHATAAALNRVGLQEVQYVNLMTEPDRFRGEPVTIEGDLWRLYEVDAGPNDYGINRFYEGWVFTGDSGNHPYRIVCTSLAKGIEPGESLRKPVRLTGYFFKREGYRSNGGVHVAPTLIAHRIEINPMPNGIPLTSGIVPYMLGAIMAIAMALLVTIVSFAISDERSSRGSKQRWQTNPQISFAGLNVPETISVEESLRQLAERERDAAVSGAWGPLLSRQAAREHAVHDEATSRQMRIDQERNEHRRQVDAVQDWARDQQSSQAEIDALHAAREHNPVGSFTDFDELNSDKLDPARHIVAKPVTTPSPVIQVPPPIAPPPVPLQSLPVNQKTAVTPTVLSNASYGASKLAEWENEVTKLNSRAGNRSFNNQMGQFTAEMSAAEQLEHDRLARERDVRDRIRRQQIESEQDEWESSESEGSTFTLSPSSTDRLELEQLERERLEREHRERERLEKERYAQERLAYERAAAARATDHDHRAAS